MARWVIKTEEDYKKARADITRKLQGIVKAIKVATTGEIMDMLAETLEKAVSMAPVEEGSLREAGHCDVNGVTFARGTIDGGITRNDAALPDTDAKEQVFEIGFWVPGGGSGREGDINAYAWVQHEHVEFFHPDPVTLPGGRTVKGGQAKFLENAINADLTSWAERVKKAMNDAAKEV